MLKDLALIVDAGTKKAGPYTLSLKSLLDAHLAVIEPHLASYGYAELRYDLIAATREELHQAARGVAETISLALDCLEDAGLEKLNQMTRHFDVIVLEQASSDRIGRIRTQG